MKAVTLTLWPALRRALIAYPIPITGDVFAPSGPVMRAVFGVCGTDAVAVAGVGDRLGGLAICAPGGAEAWRAELGLEPAPGDTGDTDDTDDTDDTTDTTDHRRKVTP